MSYIPNSFPRATSRGLPTEQPGGVPLPVNGQRRGPIRSEVFTHTIINASGIITSTSIANATNERPYTLVKTLADGFPYEPQLEYPNWPSYAGLLAPESPLDALSSGPSPWSCTGATSQFRSESSWYNAAYAARHPGFLCPGFLCPGFLCPGSRGQGKGHAVLVFTRTSDKLSVASVAGHLATGFLFPERHDIPVPVPSPLSMPPTGRRPGASYAFSSIPSDNSNMRQLVPPAGPSGSRVTGPVAPMAGTPNGAGPSHTQPTRTPAPESSSAARKRSREEVDRGLPDLESNCPLNATLKPPPPKRRKRSEVAMDGAQQRLREGQTQLRAGVEVRRQSADYQTAEGELHASRFKDCPFDQLKMNVK
ncbi:hypothetical protein BC834DRAFT_846881 [Gloeopeniophorella convolvens]|nr:hypothetical protein BC834DRAFT_846881 [Gloeopeniophorella convolvens]